MLNKTSSVPQGNSASDFHVKSNPWMPGGGQQSNTGIFAAPNAQGAIMGGHANTMNQGAVDMNQGTAQGYQLPFGSSVQAQ